MQSWTVEHFVGRGRERERKESVTSKKDKDRVSEKLVGMN